MSRPLVCPACSAALADGVEFTGQQRVDSFRELLIVGFDPYGDLAVEGTDHSYGDPKGPLLLRCGACGYEWPTTRQCGYGASAAGRSPEPIPYVGFSDAPLDRDCRCFCGDSSRVGVAHRSHECLEIGAQTSRAD